MEGSWPPRDAKPAGRAGGAVGAGGSHRWQGPGDPEKRNQLAEVAELALPQELVLIPMLQMMMVMVVLATTICIQKNAVCMIAATSLPQKNAVFADHFVGIILSIFQILT